MVGNNGLLHYNVVIAAGLLWLANNFSTVHQWRTQKISEGGKSFVTIV